MAIERLTIANYNNLENKPMLAAASEDELNALLTKGNVGKAICYKDDLKVVVDASAGNEPMAVGDEITKIYFNTSVEPDLSKLTYTDGMAGLLSAESENTPTALMAGDLSAMSGGAVVGYALLDNESGVAIYSSVEFSMGDISCVKGWQPDIIASGGAYEWRDEYDIGMGRTGTVTTVDQQDLWSSYISKEPFASGGGIVAKSVNKVTNVKVCGASVLADGVVDIPEAGANRMGVVNLAGFTAYGNIKIKENEDSTVYPYIAPESGGGLIFRMAADSTVGSSYTFYGSIGGMKMTLIPDAHRIDYSTGSDTTARAYLPEYDGSLLSAPSNFSTGTSGSTALSNSGLYEFKITYNDVVYTFVVNWNGATTTKSQMSFVSADGSTTTVLFATISAAGVVTFETRELLAGGGGAIANAFSYRKIGIA